MSRRFLLRDCAAPLAAVGRGGGGWGGGGRGAGGATARGVAATCNPAHAGGADGGRAQPGERRLPHNQHEAKEDDREGEHLRTGQPSLPFFHWPILGPLLHCATHGRLPSGCYYAVLLTLGAFSNICSCLPLLVASTYGVPPPLLLQEKKADYSKGKKARALDGTPLARLSALVTDLSDADGAAKHAAGVAASAGDATFELRPTGDDDGSVFLVQLSSGRPLHLDGFGDGLASTRYDCLDDFAKFVLETAPGDGGASGCVYLTCVANGMPLHANGLGDKLVSMRHGDIRDDWAQWVLQVVDSDA